MNTSCLNCKKPLSDKRGGAKFCCLECKNEYNYARKSEPQKDLGKVDLKIETNEVLKPIVIPDPEKSNQQDSNSTLLSETLKNVIDSGKENQSKPFKEHDRNIDELNLILNTSNLLPLKNVIISKVEIEDVDFEEIKPEGQDLKGVEIKDGVGTNENKDQSKAMQLPEKYIAKVVLVENPAYRNLTISLNEYLNQRAKLENEIALLKKQLKEQENRDGSNLVKIGGIGAGLLGFLNNSKSEPEPINPKKKSKKTFPKIKELSIWERIFKGVIYGAIGTGVGLAAKSSTDEWREQDKKEKIAMINKRISDFQNQINTIQSQILKAKASLLIWPKFLTETKKIPNPDYQKTLEGVNNMKKAQNQTPTFKSDKIIRSTELSRQEFKALNFKGLWKDFFGLPSTNFHALIHGNSGEGKSTFCLWFARYLAENFGRVLYVSGEEGFNKTFHDKLISCKANVPDLYLLDVRTGEDFVNEVGTLDFHFVILDSLHDMEIDAKKLKVIFERYKNTAFICIDQNNKKGELLGANEKKHIVDVVVNVKNFIAETTKNRFRTKGVVARTIDFTDSEGRKII